jgi:hypothetical protein
MQDSDGKCRGRYKKGRNRIIFGILMMIAGVSALLGSINVIPNYGLLGYCSVILIVK